jgi:hypothetical protein
MELLEAAKKINDILAESAKTGDSVPTVLDKLSEVKVHGVVFPRIMLVELIGEYADKIAKNVEPDMQHSFDEAERKWSKMN